MSFLAFQQAHPQQRFSEQLRSYHQTQWDKVIHHRFTVELGEDRLSDAVFARYLVQDYAFLRVFIKLLAYAIAHAPEMSSKRTLAGFLAAVTSDENTYFIRSFTALGIPSEQYHHPKLNAPAKGFISQLSDAAESGYAESIVALSVPEWTYRSWANMQGNRTPKRFYLHEWITLHNNPAFNAFVDWLLHETDRVGAAHPKQHEALSARFADLLCLEEAFFTAAYDEEHA